VQKEEYLIKNACYSPAKYHLCKQNNKRSLLGRKQRSQVVRSFPNRYQFSCINKVISLFSIRYILMIILRGEAIFIVRKKNLIRSEALRSLVLPTFSSTFLLYISCFHFFILSSMHVKFYYLRIYFRFFCVKKFVVCLVVMGFCSTFALAFQRFGVRFSIKKAIFERIP